MASHLRPFKDIARTFAQSIEAARVFTHEIARHADAHDEATWERLTFDMLRFVGVPEERLDELRREFVEIEARSAEQREAASEASFDEQRKEFEELMTEAIMGAAEEHPERRGQLLRLARRARAGAAAQGRLLRQSALTLMISFFESLISDLVQAYYLRFPEALPADSQTLTLAELRQMGSIEDAESFIAAKESERLLRESFENQMKFFASRAKVPFEQWRKHVDSMIEISQRRNVIVHNNGVANRVYVEKTPKVLIEQYGVVEGQALPTSPHYIAEALTTVRSVGFLLVQHCWRRWEKSDIEAADAFAAEQIYDLLVEARYDAALALAAVTEGLDLQSDERRRVVVINKAVALRELGRSNEALAILDAVDWSATSLRFRCVVAALRANENDFYTLAEKCIASGEIKRSELEEWPALQPLRTSDRFQDLLSRAVESPPNLSFESA